MKYRLKKRYTQTRKHKSSGDKTQTDLCSKDFYRYVNGRWLRSVHVPPYLSAFGISEEIEKQIEKELFEIAYSCQRKFREGKKGQPESLVGTVVESILRTHVQQNSVDFLKELIQKLGCIHDMEGVASSMGDMCRHKVPTCIEIDGKYFDQHDKEYTLSLQRGVVGLPDQLYYDDKSPGRWKTLHYYTEYLMKVGKSLQIPNLTDIIPLEKQLAPFIFMKKIKEKEVSLQGTDLERLYTHVPWYAFFQAFGLPDWRKRTYAVPSKEWLGIVDNLFQKQSIETWKLLLTSQLIHHFIAYLPPPFDDYHYEFFRKRLRGQAQKLPQKYLMLEVLTDWYAPFMSELFSKRIEPNLRTQATKFAEEIREAALHRLDQVEWFTPRTRSLAKEKVKKMLLSIAYPNQFSFTKHLTFPKVTPDNLVKNLLMVGWWKTHILLERLGTHRNDTEAWEDPIYAVNGYYYADDNELIIPTGSLYSPFYDDKKPLGWNYGGVGVIMGHEITHAFDEEGKEYDPAGYRKPWWTASDKQKYTNVTKDLIRLYNKQTVLGHPVDGESTLSENIADLGGLAIALDALNLALEKQKVSLSERKAAYRQFFISYAVSWRIKERPEKQIQGLLVDRHAPAPLRVNLVVNQFQEWYDAFDVVPDDPMYVPPEKRLRIF